MAVILNAIQSLLTNVLPWDYAWSSATAYTGGNGDALVRIDQLSSYVQNGKTPKERAGSYKRYLLSESELWQIDADLFGGTAPAIGDDEFIAQAVSKAGRMISRRIGRPQRV